MITLVTCLLIVAISTSVLLGGTIILGLLKVVFGITFGIVEANIATILMALAIWRLYTKWKEWRSVKSL